MNFPSQYLFFKKAKQEKLITKGSYIEKMVSANLVGDNSHTSFKVPASLSTDGAF